MQKFQDVQIADIPDDPDEPQQLVAHFKGDVQLEDKFWRDRRTVFSTVYTFDELPAKFQLAQEAESKGEKVPISSKQLLKGQGHLEAKRALLDEDIIDGTDLLLWERPHYKYKAKVGPT